MQIDIVLLFNFLEYASRGFRRERMQVAAIMVVLSYGSMCQNFVVPGAHGYDHVVDSRRILLVFCCSTYIL